MVYQGWELCTVTLRNITMGKVPARGGYRGTGRKKQSKGAEFCEGKLGQVLRSRESFEDVQAGFTYVEISGGTMRNKKDVLLKIDELYEKAVKANDLGVAANCLQLAAELVKV